MSSIDWNSRINSVKTTCLLLPSMELLLKTLALSQPPIQPLHHAALLLTIQPSLLLTFREKRMLIQDAT